MRGPMSKRPTTGGLRCTTCGEESVIMIELRLPDGTEVDFCSCHRCESRWWNRDGEHLALDAVLDLTRRDGA